MTAGMDHTDVAIPPGARPTSAAAVEAIRTLAGRQCSDKAIGDLLGYRHRTVRGVRDRHRIPVSNTRYGRRPARDGYDASVVQELLAGLRPAGKPSAADMAETVRRLAGQHYSDGQAACLLGVSRRTVARIREANSIPPGVPPGDSATRPVNVPTLPWSRN